MFFMPVAATVDFMVSRIGRKGSTGSSNGRIGPIRDIIKSTVAVTGIEQIRNVCDKPYSWILEQCKRGDHFLSNELIHAMNLTLIVLW